MSDIDGRLELAAEIARAPETGVRQARDVVVAAATSIITEHGLAALTFRDLAAKIGRSTTVIFNLFPTKPDLLQAVLEVSASQDLLRCEAFFAAYDGLSLSRNALETVLARFIMERARGSDPHARVVQEFLVQGRGAGQLHSTSFSSYYKARRRTLEGFLKRAPELAVSWRLVADYLLMEELYATALAGEADYDLLLREALSGVTSLAFSVEPDAPSAPTASWIVAALPIPQPPDARAGSGSLKLQLLNAAADQILEAGIGAVTNRSVTQRAGASTSMIPYHYGDMAAFLVEAIWHCVFREIPQHLAPGHSAGLARPENLSDWLRLVSPMLEPATSTNDTPGGFYVRYARLIGQICLLAARDLSFKKLSLLLRAPEGEGTFRSRDVAWPSSITVTRLSAATFAMWIKGRALSGAVDADDSEEARQGDLLLAATTLMTGPGRQVAVQR